MEIQGALPTTFLKPHKRPLYDEIKRARDKENEMVSLPKQEFKMNINFWFLPPSFQISDGLGQWTNSLPFP